MQGSAYELPFRQRVKGIVTPHSPTELRSKTDALSTQDVSDQKLDMTLARRLLWESIRVVETSDWSCLYMEDEAQIQSQSIDSPAPTTAVAIKAQITAGEISSQQAAQSVYVPKSLAQSRVEMEFDVDVLKRQAGEVKKALLALGAAEKIDDTDDPAPEYSGKDQAATIVPVDLSHAEVFKRLAMKRAWTFERYFCPERSCDVDCTRLDALLRHCHNSHGNKRKKGVEKEDAKGKGKSAGASRKAGKGKAKKGANDDEWLNDEDMFD